MGVVVFMVSAQTHLTELALRKANCSVASRRRLSERTVKTTADV